MVCGGRANSSLKQPTTGFGSWDVWKSQNPRPCLLRIVFPILPLIGETSAACPRLLCVIRAGMWRSSYAGLATRIILLSCEVAARTPLIDGSWADIPWLIVHRLGGS